MGDVELVRLIERAPMRTLRWEDLDQQVPNAARTLARLVDKGAVTRIARGVYVVPPDGADGRSWKAPLETAALALGTARHGQRRVVLTGIGAARYWHAIPRALAETTIAVSERGRHPVILETGGTVRFVNRDIDRLEATLEHTELGEALVATPAQTVWDLLADRRAVLAGERAEAVRNLRPRVEISDIAALAARAERVPAGVTTWLNERGRDV